MGLVLLVTAGLAFWISAWALGIKSLDAFLVTVAIGLLAAAIHIVQPFIRGLLGRQQP